MEWGLRGGFWLCAAAACATVAWAIALCVCDVRERRLPNVLTVPAGVLAAAAAVVWPQVLIGVAIWAGLYLLLFLFGGVGAGDVKLAVPLGALVCAAAGWPAVLLAVFLAQLVTLAWALATRSPTVPHAPPMFLGAALAVVVCS